MSALLANSRIFSIGSNIIVLTLLTNLAFSPIQKCSNFSSVNCFVLKVTVSKIFAFRCYLSLLNVKLIMLTKCYFSLLTVKLLPEILLVIVQCKADSVDITASRNVTCHSIRLKQCTYVLLKITLKAEQECERLVELEYSETTYMLLKITKKAKQECKRLVITTLGRDSQKQHICY